EALVSRLSAQDPPEVARAGLSPDWIEIQSHLEEKLGTVVRIRPRTRGRGQIELSYANPDELERLVELLIYLGERLEPRRSSAVL
ncbi:MAG: hypothetical protein AB1758_36310, partial [Candidatus Eremiobacterota bacterium]